MAKPSSMRRITLLVAFMLATAALPAAATEDTVLLFTFRDPRITESSGVASWGPGRLLTHNDSGDTARFFGVDDGGATVATFTVAFPGTNRAVPAVDWEDMAVGPGVDGGSSVWLADFGDNARVRPFVLLHEVAVPDAAGNATLPARTHVGIYEDGPHDAEGFFVLPDARPGIVTKETDGRSGVYVGESLPGDAYLFVKQAELDLDPIASPYLPDTHFSPQSRLLVTGADYSSALDRLVVRTYVDAFEWTITGDLAESLTGAPERIEIPYTQQGEAISYDGEGLSLLLTSEGVFAPVHLARPD